MIKKLIIFIMLIALCSIVSGGNITSLSVYQVTDKSITWNFNDTSGIKSISVDSININNFDNKSQLYTLDGITALSYHGLCVYANDGDSQCLYGKTTGTQDNTNNLTGWIFQYIWLIFAIILLSYAMISKNQALGYISMIPAAIGLIAIVNTHQGSFLLYMLHVVVLIGGYFAGSSELV
jgi:hypothetical protein